MHAHVWLVGLVFISIKKHEDGPGTQGRGQLVAPLTDEEGEEEPGKKDKKTQETSVHLKGLDVGGQKEEAWLALFPWTPQQEKFIVQGLDAREDTIGCRGGCV